MTEPELLPTATARRSRRRILELLRRRRGQVVAVIVIAVVASAVQLLGPALVGLVIDVIVDVGTGTRSADEASGVVLAAAFWFAGAAILGAALVYLGSVRAARLGEASLADLRRESFRHAIAGDVDRVERAGTGELVARLTGDIAVLAKVIQETVPVVMLAVVELSLIFVAFVLVDPRLGGLAILAALPAMSVGTIWYLRVAPARYRREREAHADYGAELLEAYGGRTTLLAHGAVEPSIDQVDGAGRSVIEAEMATAAARNVIRPATRVALACSLVVVIAAGASFVADGAMSVGSVGAIALYLVRAFEPIGTILEELDEIQQASAAMARVVGVESLGIEPRDGHVEVPSRDSIGGESDGTLDSRIAIALQGVSFAYDATPVVRDVDLEVHRGERLVIVGASGAGKSTIAKLLVGFHRPQTGRVVRAAQLRTALATQESHAFARSVRDNVTVGRVAADDDEIMAALDVVGLSEWVEGLPHGLDTEVAGDEHPLESTRRQRLALARLVCAAPDLVVLDEATASLDPIAAASTEAALEAAISGRTVVTIAHRLDAAERADRVVVMEEGRIAAVGTHTELVETSEAYRSAWVAWIAQRS